MFCSHGPAAPPGEEQKLLKSISAPAPAELRLLGELRSYRAWDCSMGKLGSVRSR